MIYSPELLDRLQAIAPAPCERTAFRHMLAGRAPEGENTRGARGNRSSGARFEVRGEEEIPL